MQMNTKQIASDCRRFAYVYGIDLSGNEKTGIAVAHEGYATAFDTWAEVLFVFQYWREHDDFRNACLNAIKREAA